MPKRISFVQASKQRLESAYRENSKPSGPMMLDLARQIGFDRDVVRLQNPFISNLHDR